MPKKKIDPATAPKTIGTNYPPPFDARCLGRSRLKLGDAAGLTQFGVNLCTLPPGAWTSQRHWHTHADEFIYIVSGEVVMVTDAGEETMRAGDSAGFKAGDNNGHHFQNRSDADAVLLEVGTRYPEDGAFYPDLDLVALPGGAGYAHVDGTPYPKQERRT